MQKSARIEFKVAPDNKAIFERAAQLMGVSLTEFGVQAMTLFAKKVTEEQMLVQLSATQQALFYEALTQPAEPNDSLKAAFMEYQKTFASSGNEK